MAKAVGALYEAATTRDVLLGRETAQVNPQQDQAGEAS